MTREKGTQYKAGEEGGANKFQNTVLCEPTFEEMILYIQIQF